MESVLWCLMPNWVALSDRKDPHGSLARHGAKRLKHADLIKLKSYLLSFSSRGRRNFVSVQHRRPNELLCI